MARSAKGRGGGGGTFGNVVLPLLFGVAILVEVGVLLTRQSRVSPQVACPSQQPCSLASPAAPVLPAAPHVPGSPAVPPLAVTAETPVPTAQRNLHPPFLSKDRRSGDVPAVAKPAGTAVRRLPFYDIIALIFATGSEHDVLRMEAAAKTWLGWKPTDGNFTYLYVLCIDDPGLKCKKGEASCPRSNPNVIIVPCKHGYSTIVTKSTEGFRYLAHNYRFNYVLKADIDTMVEMGCIRTAVKAVHQQSGHCRSFGMGGWRMARSSKVFTKQDPGAGKYPNEQFKEDSGMSFYPPYMVGWLSVWSADVARFLGMGGLPSSRMPKWKDTWTIDDAAIGTFVLGLDMCRLEVPCRVVTDVEYEQFQWHWDGDVRGLPLKIKYDGPIKGYKGPLRDDVPGLGDIADVWTATLEECADRCTANPECRSFEHSPTRGKRSGMLNCQLATGTQRTGHQVDDFSLYIKEVKYVEDGPIDGFEGPIGDDVPGLGDLANIYTEDLQACAQKCLQDERCKSFEHSPTPRVTVGIKNCQLNSGINRAGVKFQDFSLYLRKFVVDLSG